VEENCRRDGRSAMSDAGNLIRYYINFSLAVAMHSRNQLCARGQGRQEEDSDRAIPASLMV
jgi:hypothetical protein